MVVLISTNFITAFNVAYGFQPWQSGLTYISSIVGALIAILCGGWITDRITDKLTSINRGIWTPEMRLPLMIIPLITGPLSCMLYGVGVAKSLHWICPVIGIRLGKTSYPVPLFHRCGHHSSRIYNCPGNECLLGIYSGLLPSHLGGSCRDAECIRRYVPGTGSFLTGLMC